MAMAVNGASMSTPMAWRPARMASPGVVPEPDIGSRTASPGTVYVAMARAATAGCILAGWVREAGT